MENLLRIKVILPLTGYKYKKSVVPGQEWTHNGKKYVVKRLKKVREYSDDTARYDLWLEKKNV
jgi:hypothetical protein